MDRLKSIALINLLCITLAVVYSCGDIFATRRHIVGNYYLLEEEGSTEYSVAYKLMTGDYIGRVAAPVVEYGWTDSILVVKSRRDTIGSVYIMNMIRDYEIAEEAAYLIEILSDEEFNNRWQKILKIKFKKV